MIPTNMIIQIFEPVGIIYYLKHYHYLVAELYVLSQFNKLLESGLKKLLNSSFGVVILYQRNCCHHYLALECISHIIIYSTTHCLFFQQYLNIILSIIQDTSMSRRLLLPTSQSFWILLFGGVTLQNTCIFLIFVIIIPHCQLDWIWNNACRHACEEPQSES